MGCKTFLYAKTDLFPLTLRVMRVTMMGIIVNTGKKGKMMFSLQQFPLPFAPDALAPYMSAETVGYHYGRHLDTYIKKLNELIGGTEYARLGLGDIIMRSARDEHGQKIFDNAAQVFNHAFFFQGLRRDCPREMPEQIADAFGGADKFRAEFRDHAASVFGSGWTWLVIDGDTLRIIDTKNADTPMVHNMRPILTLDVWEHAYYLDYQNRRAEYIDAFLDHMINWCWVGQNLGGNM